MSADSFEEAMKQPTLIALIGVQPSDRQQALISAVTTAVDEIGAFIRQTEVRILCVLVRRDRLPHLFGQMATWLGDQHAAGREAHDQGRDASKYVDAATGEKASL